MKDVEALAPRILMVDDNPSNLLALEAILEPLGQPMVRANSADEAFRHLLEGDFAVILMDVQMPGTDGFAAAALIKSRERTRMIPIIFITALSRDMSFVYQGYEYGAVDYILKPVEPIILRSKVAVFVQLHLQRQQIVAQGQQLLEAREQRSERRYRALSDSLPISVWVTDEAGKLTYSNRRMQGTCGISQAILERSGWLTCVHPDDLDRVRTAWDDARQKGARAEVEFRMRHRDASYRWQMASLTEDDHRADETDAPRAWIVAATDIEAQKVAQAETERASRLKDEFLATVSHELRTPLNAILGWSQTLLETSLPPEKVLNALRAIERNARAQADIIGDILDVSRIITGKVNLSLEEVSMGPLVNASLEVLRAAAEAKAIHFTVELPDDTNLVLGDASRLNQILWNLLSNAVKFTARGGNVHIAMRRDDAHVEIAVRDNGSGIAPDFLPFVFDRFRQADSSTTRTHGGLGLGLAIVKHFVELHGGDVAAHSEGKGCGSTFIVRLPRRFTRADRLTEEPQVFNTPSEPADRGAPVCAVLSGKKVLVVDDDNDARDLLEMVFVKKGAQVVSAESAEEAFRYLADFTPELIVSDIGMPNEDGYSLMRRVRASTPERGGLAPAIALTGFARKDDGLQAMEAGFQAHIAKPVETAKLMAIVERLLSGQ